MDRTERFYKIDQMIRERGVVSFAQLMETLEISRATLKRDLEYLRSRLNAPIVWDRDAGGYRFERQPNQAASFELPGMWFSAAEIHALLSMEQLLRNLDPGGLLTPHTAPLMKRLTKLLGPDATRAATIRDRVLILGAARRAPRLQHFERVGAALVQRRRLRITYLARGTGERSNRVVSPQRLVHYRENWYLDAWCHLRQGLRNFAVDAIESAELLSEPARELPLAAVQSALGPGYGIIATGRVRRARLRFTPERARWVAHEIWHPDQKGRFEASGHYVLDLPYADDRELLMDILKYGAGVEVLAPASLRQRVMTELDGLRTLYVCQAK
jgi:predicted DNA-binding transcriptional regulator YafY